MLKKDIIICIILNTLFLITAIISDAQEINKQGWPVPNLRGLVPYSISINSVDGVEKVVERFYTPDGGNVARISGNGKVFAYVVDKDQIPPIDYLILDPDGSGRFTHKYSSKESYSIPEWVSY